MSTATKTKSVTNGKRQTRNARRGKTIPAGGNAQTGAGRTACETVGMNETATAFHGDTDAVQPLTGVQAPKGEIMDNFQQLYGAIKGSEIDLAKRLINLSDGTGAPVYRQRCPLCKGHDTFTFCSESATFHCERCRFNSTIVFLVQRIRNVPIGTAYAIVSKAFLQLIGEDKDEDEDVLTSLTGQQSPRTNEKRCDTCERGGAPCNCYVAGHTEGFDAGCAKGYVEWFQRGLEHGCEKGYGLGYDDGRAIGRIESAVSGNTKRQDEDRVTWSEKKNRHHDFLLKLLSMIDGGT